MVKRQYRKRNITNEKIINDVAKPEAQLSASEPALDIKPEDPPKPLIRRNEDNTADKGFEKPATAQKMQKPKLKTITIYHKNSDWNWILTAYFENPDKPNFSKYGYANVSIDKRDTYDITFRWNGKTLNYKK
jgi:hypothetical protein